MIDTRTRKRIDIPLLIIVYLLAFAGVFLIYAATRMEARPMHATQMRWLAIGTVAMLAAAFVDFHFYERLIWPLYIVNLFQLILVKLPMFHADLNGGARWISIAGFRYQPSEFAKVIVILTLAAFLVKYRKRMHEPLTLFLSLLFVAAPVLLIKSQPDLGTALVIVVIWFGMLFVGGAKLKHLGAIAAVGILGLTFLLVTGIGMKTFQKDRIEAYLHPNDDVNGIAYQTNQARIAIGSGGLFGKGLLNSQVIARKGLPEKESDFIFSSVGEEFGFAGCVVVISLYAWLLWRCVRIAALADEDPYGKLIATGIVSMFSFHILENIGMNVGVVPVAGVPLLLLSYGGSNILMTFICIGLLEGIMMHRHKLIF